MLEKKKITFFIEEMEKIKKINDNGVEYWSARDLQNMLGYSLWKRFEETIKKAMESCFSNKIVVSDHFVGADKMVAIGSNTGRNVKDYHLTRYACYLIAQNGDPRKEQIAMAQQYFAIQTRRKELEDQDFETLTEDEKRLLLRRDMTTHNNKLFSAAKQAGIKTNLDFAVFNNFGYKGLYNGLDRDGIAERKGVKKGKSILDVMGTTELAANRPGSKNYFCCEFWRHCKYRKAHIPYMLTFQYLQYPTNSLQKRFWNQV
ncbi:hypothetical protein FACS1894152_4420 [Bacilli bacterium]|nr:hypothetical protein FACS1894152_4420 [Bacilli bacterium]